MANVLSEALLAVQDNIVRYPIVEIKAGQFAEDIPLQGQRLNSETLDQDDAVSLTHSSGRLVSAYVQDGYTVKLVYTDTGRTEFFYADLLAALDTNTISDLSLVEMADGNLALAYVLYASGKYHLKIAVFAYDGSGLQQYSVLVDQALPIRSPSINRTASGYLLVYIQDIAITAASGGTYTGSQDDTFYLQVVTDGSETTATYKWKFGAGGTWSEPVAMGGTQSLQNGVTVSFGAGDYWAGQEFWFTVKAERFAKGYITAEALPVDGDQVTVGATTYTFKSALSSPAVANEVLIDPLGQSITMENLRCAIVAGAFEGTGEGVRYGAGTAANASVTASRSDKELTLTALASGTGGNSIMLTVDGTRLTKVAFSGGAATVLGAMEWTPSNKLYTKTATTPSGTWAAASIPAISGVVVTRKKLDSFLFRQDDGTIWLFFTYLTTGNSELTAVYNLLYTKSSDNGAAWGTAVSLTSFTTPNEIVRRPVAVQKLATEIVIAYDSVRTSLTKDKSDSLWTDESEQSCRGTHFNPATRKLYVPYGRNFAGDKILYGIVRIDVDTWEIDRYWNANTVPSIPYYFRVDHSVTNTTGAGQYVAIRSSEADNARQTILLLDDSANTIVTLSNGDNSSYGVTKNIDGLNALWSDTLTGMTIDATNQRLYVGFYRVTTKSVWAGYIDFSGGSYEFTSVVPVTNTTAACDGEFSVDLENGYLLFSGAELRVHLLNGGGLWKSYTYSTNYAFPYVGANYPVISGGKIFASIDGYTADYGQSNYWGLICINPANDSVTVLQPTSVLGGSPRDAQMKQILALTSGELVVSCPDGVAIYSTLDGTWRIINNSTVAGVFPEGMVLVGHLDYDPAGNLLFFGCASGTSVFTGVVAFPLEGKIEQTKYIGAQYSGSVWVLASPAPLFRGTHDFGAALAVDPATHGLYAFWTHWNAIEGDQVYWDKEAGIFDLTADIVRDQKIEQKRTVDGVPGSVSFTLLKGHLYDPSNKSSLLSRYLRKGKKILFRLGEAIDGVDCWQDGTSIYVVKTVALTYKNGSLPQITVTAEDRRTLWEDIGIIASEYYAGSAPDAVLSDILQAHAGVLQADIDFSSLSADDAIYYQWLDTDLKAAVESICDRYGCFIDIGLSDNVIRARKLSANNAVDHTYASANLIDFTPDDSYSSYVNRVTVTGEGRTDIDVETSEESIGRESGTLGFFCCEQVHRIWYSSDHQLRAARPRLEITQNVSSIAFKMGGKMRQWISATDPDGKWVEVTSKAPNLIPILVAAIGAYMAADNMPPVVTSGGLATSKTESRIKAAAIYIITQCLAAVGNYSFTIWASPIGQVRQTFQASANDTELQNELNGTIITQTIDDPLVYDVSQAQQVANHDLWVIQSQRKRVKFQKVAHLQDDAGDTIVLPHPYTQADLKMIITNLTRTMYLPGSNGLGTITDSIEGWLL